MNCEYCEKTMGECTCINESYAEADYFSEMGFSSSDIQGIRERESLNDEYENWDDTHISSQEFFKGIQ